MGLSPHAQANGTPVIAKPAQPPTCITCAHCQTGNLPPRRPRYWCTLNEDEPILCGDARQPDGQCPNGARWKKRP